MAVTETPPRAAHKMGLLRTTFVLFGICMLLAAIIAGAEQKHDERVVSVPVTVVDPAVCVANGPVVEVTYKLGSPNVYSATCKDGVVLTTGARYP